MIAYIEDKCSLYISYDDIDNGMQSVSKLAKSLLHIALFLAK